MKRSTSIYRNLMGVVITVGIASAAAHAEEQSSEAQDARTEQVTDRPQRVGPANVEVPTPRTAHASAYDEDPREAAKTSDTTRQDRHHQGDREAAVEADEGVSVGQVREGTPRGATGLSNGSPGIDD